MVASIGDLRASVRLNWKMLLICAGLTAFTGCTWYSHSFQAVATNEKRVGDYGISVHAVTWGGSNEYKHSEHRSFDFFLKVNVRERTVPDDSAEVALIDKRFNFWSVLVQTCDDGRTLGERGLFQRLNSERGLNQEVSFKWVTVPDSIQNVCVKIPYTYTEHGTDILCDTLTWEMHRVVNKYKALMVD